MNPKAKLCYVKKHAAWFTTAQPGDIWGDDWNDAPYEHNAGEPYYWHSSRGVPAYELFKVYFDADLQEPCDGYLNCPWSVEDINGGAAAWLVGHTTQIRNNEDAGRVVIPAWVPYDEFCHLIEMAGGEVYEPRS